MPPIFGIINTKFIPITLEHIQRMTASATYVKPRELLKWTGHGFFVATAVNKTENNEYAVSGPWLCIADAAIYKHKKNYSGAGGAAEYILEMWLEWKEDCIKHLYGDFAFLILSTETGEIFCGRDHMGVRPMFYYVNESTFIFASELRIVLTAIPEIPRIREGYLLDTFVSKKSKKSQTPFVNIQTLMPAHFLHFNGKRLISKKYWSFNPSKRIQFKSNSDYISLLREKIVTAVELRCSVTKTGVELSGGLDSSAIAGIAAREHEKKGGNLSAFSNVLPQGIRINFKDEREFIDEMIGFTSLNWIGIDCLGSDIPDLLQHAIRIQGCYIQQNFSIFNNALYQAVSADHISILLSGFGGDEMVSASVAIQWNELIRNKQWSVLKDELFFRGRSFKSMAKALILAIRYIASFIKKPGYTSSIFTKEYLNKRFDNFPLQHNFAVKYQLKKRLENQYKKQKQEVLAMKQVERIMHDHLPQRMEYCYTAAMQYGIEYRYPLLDLDLLETFLAFPPWLKQHNGINRYAFREAITGFVPEKIRMRKDKSDGTIPQTYNSLVNERLEILNILKKVSNSVLLCEIFDYSKFISWYEKLVKRDPIELNSLMHGAFYTYLMLVIYYHEREVELNNILGE